MNLFTILTCVISLPLTYKTANNQQAVLRMIHSTANSMRQNIGKRESVVHLETIGGAKTKILKLRFAAIVIIVIPNITKLSVPVSILFLALSITKFHQ